MFIYATSLNVAAIAVLLYLKSNRLVILSNYLVIYKIIGTLKPRSLSFRVNLTFRVTEAAG